MLSQRRPILDGWRRGILATMRLEPLGERAYLMSDLPAAAPLVARALEAAALEGVLEIVPSYETVGLYVDPDRFHPDAVPETYPGLESTASGTLHVIPACYELGEDLPAAAEALGLTSGEVAALHAGSVYLCAAIGFCPGFPYLGPLPDELSGLGRHADPRTRVPRGSVAITGRQTGIYTLERPGGWWLIGRTPLELVHVEDAYFPIAPGDSVRFEPIGAAEYENLLGRRL